MRPSYHVCSLVCSTRGAREFRLFHASAKRWADYRFLVACPPSLDAELSALEGVSPLPIVDPALPYAESEERDYFSERCRRLLRYKIDVCRAALGMGQPAFFMDADTIIVGPLEIPMEDWLSDHDIVASPHYLAPEAEVDVGHYNAGMLYTTNAGIIEKWDLEMDRGVRDFGEQCAFNRAVAGMRVRDLPMHFNVGAWRYRPTAHPHEPLEYRDGRFWINGHAVYNFHLRLGRDTDLERAVANALADSDCHPEFREALRAAASGDRQA